MLFWVAMALIVGGSIAITFTIAAHEYEAPELQRRPGAAIQASEVLARGGIGALQDLAGQEQERHPRPRPVHRRPRTARTSSGGACRRTRAPPGVLQSRRVRHRCRALSRRAAPQIVGPDGSAYTVLLVPRRPSIFGALSLPEISTGHPVHRAGGERAHQLVAGAALERAHPAHSGGRARAGVGESRCAVRVSAGLEGRKDELAVLARDFDAMADQLRANRGAVTQLLRDISHELRSPLARMRVALGPGAPAARRSLAPVGSAGAGDRTPRCADQPGIEARPPARHRRAVRARDLRSRRGDRGSRARRELRGRREELHGRVSQGAAHAAVNGNRELLRSAIENVLRNAVRYSPQDAPVDVAVVARRGQAS